MSGLSHTPGKRAKGYTFRGFESRLLRQMLSPVSIVFTGLFGFRGNGGSTANWLQTRHLTCTID